MRRWRDFPPLVRIRQWKRLNYWQRVGRIHVTDKCNYQLHLSINVIDKNRNVSHFLYRWANHRQYCLQIKSRMQPFRFLILPIPLFLAVSGTLLWGYAEIYNSKYVKGASQRFLHVYSHSELPPFVRGLNSLTWRRRYLKLGVSFISNTMPGQCIWTGGYNYCASAQTRHLYSEVSPVSNNILKISLFLQL